MQRQAKSQMHRDLPPCHRPQAPEKDMMGGLIEEPPSTHPYGDPWEMPVENGIQNMPLVGGFALRGFSSGLIGKLPSKKGNGDGCLNRSGASTNANGGTSAKRNAYDEK